MDKPCFLSSSTHKNAKLFRKYLKQIVLDPKRAKLKHNSDFGHVRKYSWLHKSKTTQGKYMEHI